MLRHIVIIIVVKKTLKKVQVSNITQINDLIYIGVAVVIELIGIKNNLGNRRIYGWKDVWKDKLNSWIRMLAI